MIYLRGTSARVLGALILTALVMGGCRGSLAPQQSVAPPVVRQQQATIAPVVQQPTQELAATPSDQIVIRDDYGSDHERLAVVESASGTRQRDLPFGAVAPDWSAIYTAEANFTGEHPRTTVRAVDLATGKVLRQTEIDGAYVLPAVTPDGLPGGLSPAGRWLVLQEAPGQTSGRWQSPFAVLDSAFQQPPRLVNLDIDGLYHFDGLSNNGNNLYLIEYLSSPSVGLPRYQVRAYDMVQGKLDPQVVVVKGEESIMAGVHQLSANGATGEWRYGLYLNSDHGPFIHALNLDNRFAICIDLPTQGKEDQEKQQFWSLAMSGDGKTLYAVNGALNLVADLDLTQVPQQVRRISSLTSPAAQSSGIPHAIAHWLAPIAEAKPEHGRGPIGPAIVSLDGKTLFTLGEQGVLAINTGDLTLRGRYLADQALTSIALSPDGARLYAGSAEQGKLLQLDPATGQVVSEMPGSTGMWSVMRVVGE